MERIEQRLADERFAEIDVSFSAAIDGYTETLDHNADLELLPASNQKIITALGVAELLDFDQTFVTTAQRYGSDLHLVAGGDPTLSRASLDTIARSVAASGLSDVQTLYIVDRYTGDVAAPGWEDWQLPAYVGPLSAFMVDDNRYRSDEAFVDEPALLNGELFADLLRSRGVRVGDVATWDLDDTPVGSPEELGRVESRPFDDLAATMLLSSDNQNADQLVSEIGFRFGDGSIAGGTAAIDEALNEWCLNLAGHSGDGSGLSRANQRSAGEFRRLLEHARGEPWFEWFDESLPVAAQSGTLSRRFSGTAAAGNVRAKTGSIFVGRALSGYGTTVDDREFVFSVIINGEPQNVSNAQPAMDALIAELAA